MRFVPIKTDDQLDLAGNQVSLADVKMVWAFWHQQFGSRVDEIDNLIQALRMFRKLRK